MGARRTAPNVVNTPTGTRPTREDERERMPIADDPVTRPSFFRSPAQERSASRIPFLTPEFKEKMKLFFKSFYQVYSYGESILLRQYF